MATRYEIQQGDSVAKLAKLYGFFPGTIWDHAENAKLKELRGDMNVLAPGDSVYIPDKRQTESPCDTGLRHVFRRRSVPMLFRVQLLNGRVPRANLPYVLQVDGVELNGTTDGEGRVERYIPNDAQRGRLVVDKGAVDVPLDFGYMDPVSSVEGVQKRLINLGYSIQDDMGVLGGDTRTALRNFQSVMGLKVTDEPDDQTRKDLLRSHDEPGVYAAALAKAAKAGGGE